jgi:hypothetical protein
VRVLTEGQRARLIAQGRAARERREAELAARIPPVPATGAIRIVLLGCVKTKADRRLPAWQLYQGQLCRPGGATHSGWRRGGP